jgi:exo-beta-1,3-glucanase (GH17 family)
MTVRWSFLSRSKLVDPTPTTGRRLAILVPLVVLLSMLLGSMNSVPTARASTGEIGVDWFDSGAPDADLQDMQTAGVKWVRVGMFFQETSHSYMDSLIRTAAAHQIKVLLAVYPVPRNDYGTREQRQAYLSWLSQTVTRYRGRIPVWEVGNEPNLEPYWNIPGTPDDASWKEAVHRYVLHLAETYSTIKASDPSATVLVGGLSGHFMEQYIDQLADERAYRYFDAMNLHPYADNPLGVVTRVRSAQQHMNRSPGMASKPIWVTEFGWQATWPGSFMYVPSEEVKANYLAQTIPMLRKIGINTPIFCFVWYEWADITRPGASNVNGFGFVRRASANAQPVKLPAYYALRSVTTMQERAATGSDHQPSRARKSPTVASRSRLGAPAPPKMMDMEATSSSTSAPPSLPSQLPPGLPSSGTVAALPLAIGSAVVVLLGAIGVIASRRRGRRPPLAPERQDGSTQDQSRRVIPIEVALHQCAGAGQPGGRAAHRRGEGVPPRPGPHPPGRQLVDRAER